MPPNLSSFNRLCMNLFLFRRNGTFSNFFLHFFFLYEMEKVTVISATSLRERNCCFYENKRESLLNNQGNEMKGWFSGCEEMKSFSFLLFINNFTELYKC